MQTTVMQMMGGVLTEMLNDARVIPPLSHDISDPSTFDLMNHDIELSLLLLSCSLASKRAVEYGNSSVVQNEKNLHRQKTFPMQAKPGRWEQLLVVDPAEWAKQRQDATAAAPAMTKAEVRARRQECIEEKRKRDAEVSRVFFLF